ncbi:MAG: hypothetical protein ACI4MC_04480 [Candidatus Coproplasma sp.]
MAKLEDNTVESVNQLADSDIISYIGDKNANKRMLIVGNSITRHGPKDDLGWFGDWGMAADSADKDYVHVLQRKTEANGINLYTMIRQAIVWENEYKDPEILNNFSAEHGFNADIVVFRLGENVSPKDFKEEEFYPSLKNFINYICPCGKVIFTTCFWRHPVVDKCVRKLAAERNDAVIELGDLGEDDKMTANGKFENMGVAVHPGNEGMKTIADRIFTVLVELL